MKRICLSLLLLVSALAASLSFGGTKKMTVEDSLAIHRVATPKFAPDGNALLYTETEWDRKNDRQVSHIYISRALGAPPVKLTNGEKGETSPQWSPDGLWIAFLADRTAGNLPRERADLAIKSGSFVPTVARQRS